eukprot:7376439-Prymnesium_polylepis.1
MAASNWKVRRCAPAAANASTCGVGSAIAKWTSMHTDGAAARTAATVAGPIEARAPAAVGEPSATSMCSQRAPAASASRAAAASAP